MKAIEESLRAEKNQALPEDIGGYVGSAKNSMYHILARIGYKLYEWIKDGYAGESDVNDLYVDESLVTKITMPVPSVRAVKLTCSGADFFVYHKDNGEDEVLLDTTKTIIMAASEQKLTAYAVKDGKTGKAVTQIIPFV